MISVIYSQLFYSKMIVAVLRNSWFDILDQENPFKSGPPETA